MFSLVKSSVKPLYELRFRAAECGFGSGDAKPVIQQTSLKFWNGEFIFLKGLDLRYLPYIATEGWRPGLRFRFWRAKPSSRFLIFVTA